jgi:hypothetical protein
VNLRWAGQDSRGGCPPRAPRDRLRPLCLFVSILFCVFSTHAAEFAVYDIYLDPQNEPLAAYQLKIWDKKAAIKIISIEGGEHPAFQKAPYFDPKAIQRDIVKLAAFHAGTSNELPARRTRVASLHVEIGPDLKPDLAIDVQAAARPGGSRIFLQASIVKRITE